MCRTSWCLAVLVTVGLTTNGNAAILAQTGFNGSIGATEGFDPWECTGSCVPAFAVKSEGSGSLQLSKGGTATGFFTSQTGVVYVDAMLRVAGTLGFNSSFQMCVGPAITLPATRETNGGPATIIGLGSDGIVRASYFNESPTDPFVSSASVGTWEPNRWIRVTQEIDIDANCYSVWLNGKPSLTGSLSFPYPSEYIDHIRFSAPSSDVYTYVDEVRVLNHNPLTAYASTGFDGAAGYGVDEDVAGKGSGDPNWTGAWQVKGGDAKVRTINNNQVLKVTAAKKSGTTTVLREYEDQNTQFCLDFDVMIDGTLTSGSQVSIFAGPDSSSPLTPENDAGAAVMVGLNSDGNIVVADGTRSGNHSPEEVTGFQWEANKWTHISLNIDVKNQSYTLTVDGEAYNALDPLEFICKATALVDDFVLQLPAQGIDSQVGVYIDNVTIGPNSSWTPPVHTPEPSALVLGTAGFIGLVVWRWRLLGPVQK